MSPFVAVGGKLERFYTKLPPAPAITFLDLGFYYIEATDPFFRDILVLTRVCELPPIDENIKGLGFAPLNDEFFIWTLGTTILINW